MNKDLLKSILILALFLAIAVPYVLIAPELHEGALKKEQLAEEQSRIQAEIKRVYLLGKFDPALREDFVAVPAEYSLMPTKMYLRKEAYQAFLAMREGAKTSGITLNLASATRNFDYQKGLWEKKWNGTTLVEGKNLSISIPDGLERFKKILEYSAAPGTSRHHWGTDVDLGGADPAYYNSARGKKEYEWLTTNAQRFGFCQTYKGRDNLVGYNEEKWHWSYLPLSRAFTQEYATIVKEEDIKGFLGDQYVSELNLIPDYVLSINPACL